MRTRTFTTVGWEKYLVPTNPYVQNFLNKRGDEVLWQIAQNIHNSILDNKESLAFVVHVNAGSILVIQKQDFKDVLEYCNEWFVKKELYEKCAEIQKFKSDLENNMTRKKLNELRRQKEQKNLI